VNLNNSTRRALFTLYSHGVKLAAGTAMLVERALVTGETDGAQKKRNGNG